MPLLPLVLLHVLAARMLVQATASELDATCPADGCRSQREHHWPFQKGNANRTGLSPYAMPGDLSKGPTWRWVDPHTDVLSQTPVIDDDMNIYINTRGSRVYKFSPDGGKLWERFVPHGLIPSVPALMDGTFFGNTARGYVFALDMETGEEAWAVRVSPQIGVDSACLLALGGMVISAVGGDFKGSPAVMALHAANGSAVWTFNLTGGFKLYNFQASSPGDGTLVFQDSAGGLYKLAMGSGELLWQSGLANKRLDFFSTGAAVIGPNGLVYVASNLGPPTIAASGLIHAYRLSTGAPVWQRDTLAANQGVAVGRLAGSEGLSVVAGVGANPGIPPLMLLHILANFIVAPLLCLCCLGCCFKRTLQREPPRCRRSGLCLLVAVAALNALCHGYAWLCMAWGGRPNWLFFTSAKPAALVALDAETGEHRWAFTPPSFERPACEGDESALWVRAANIQWEHGSSMARYKEYLANLICLPDSWAQATIDGVGTVYAGYADGHLYAVRDADGDGLIRGGEVSKYYFGHGFQGSQAIAPRLLAVVPCGGGLYVWRA